MIEDWTFAHLTRQETLWGPHGYHRYPAKFIPQLIQRIIESCSVPDDLVGDPFLGSATTGIEALRQGRRFWGADISQVALLISRAKCIPLHPPHLCDSWQQLDAQLDTVPQIGKRPLTSAENAAIAAIDIAHATREERFSYWYPAAYRESLANILQQIFMQSEGDVRTFFLCGFSNILKRCSIWLSGSTKTQKDLDKVLGDPVPEFRRQIREMMQRNSLYWHDLLNRGIQPSELAQRCRLRSEDARQLGWPDETIDLLVTSPPYATCYEYKEIHQLTQLWFERYGILAPEDAHDVWIGSKGVSQRASSHDSLSQSTGSTIADSALAELAALALESTAQSIQREVRALRYYFQDMHKVIRELARVTAPCKQLVLIIGDSYRRGMTIPTSAALCEMALEMGFALERSIARQIPGRILISTRNKKTGRFSSVAQSDTQAYPEEYVLFFKRLS